jgi:hypothetical protein
MTLVGRHRSNVSAVAGAAIRVARAMGEAQVTENPQLCLVHRGRCGRHRNPLIWLKKNIHDGYAFVNGIVQDFSLKPTIFVQSSQ